MINEIFQQLLVALQDEPQVAEKGCFAIHRLAENRTSIAEGVWLTPDLFGALIEKLLAVILTVFDSTWRDRFTDH